MLNHIRSSPSRFEYPDLSYFQRVREEIEIKGVIEVDIDKDFMKKLEKEITAVKFRHQPRSSELCIVMDDEVYCISDTCNADTIFCYYVYKNK